MGRRGIVSALLSEVSRRGFKVIRRELRSLSADEIVRLISRIARDMIRPDLSTVVALENLPPADEGDVARQAQALERVLLAGASVILTLPPESSGLLELLAEARVIWSSDLLAYGLSEARHSGFPDDVVGLTRGIPSLVRVLGDSRYASGASPSLPQTYYDALSSLYSSSLRRGLADEELRVRLAILLLGEGTRADLERVVGRDPSELLGRFCSDVPLFGVSANLESFFCLGSRIQLASVLSLPRLRSACLAHQDILDAATGLLVERGVYRRAALLCGMAPRGLTRRLVVEHGAEFLEVYEAGLVQRSLAQCQLEGDETSSNAALLQEALCAVSRRSPFPVNPEVPNRMSEPDRAALMLVDSRRLLQGELSLLTDGIPPEGTLAYRLFVHHEACALLAEGRMGAALTLLAAHPCERGDATLSRSLLELDLEVARTLVGDGGGYSESRLDEALSRLSSIETAGLASYPALATLIGDVLEANPRAPVDADALAARAERAGDSLAHVIALLAGCICDLRGAAAARAGVRALLAKTLAQSRGLLYLGRVSSLLGEVSRFMLGERIAPEREEASSDDLSRVRRVVEDAMDCDVVGHKLSDVGEDVPRDALWLLRVLCSGMGDFSALIREVIPGSWRRALLVAGDGGESELAGEDTFVESLASELSKPPLGGDLAPIEVSLLGGFAVYVRGTRIPDWKLERRNAKAVLEFLVLQHGGSAKRFKLVEQVWPGSDYVTGYNKAYQATSLLRAAIAEIEPDLDPFVTTRSSSEISLDMGMVQCDVDAFRILAKEASDAVDPARALAMARRAERIYGGDLYMPALDSLGFIASMRRELKGLYADAMVAGADAALRQGQERTAARLASNALSADDLREDAVVILVQALAATGRDVEAERRFRSYRNRLKRAGGRAPSERLVELMDSLSA